MHQHRVSSFHLLSVGVKILLGVALASNLFIGTLLYVNLQSSRTLNTTVDDLLTLREELSTNLRQTIVELQDTLLGLPDFFHIDPRKEILTMLEKEFSISKRETLEGRESYTALYSRKERRDLAHNGFIVQTGDTLSISYGLLDTEGTFRDAVLRLTLSSSDLQTDGERLRNLVESVSAAANSPDALRKRVTALNAEIADASLEAEATRTEILAHVENIASTERQLAATRQQQRTFTLSMGAVAIVANLIVLFFLVRRIVEKPLKDLTRTIERINSGESMPVPYALRRDQIGVLSGAITRFQEALQSIQADEQRKSTERALLQEMFDSMTRVVHSLDDQSRELVDAAGRMQELAATTQEQSQSVSSRAEETALHTTEVTKSTAELQRGFTDVQHEVVAQNRIVASILADNTSSRESANGLREAISSVHAIIDTVRDITDQTKLLALNATIEAARAGNAGKGFGVVASEVKQLSLKTEQATAEVMEKIAAIEGSARLLFHNIDAIDQRMQTLSRLTANINNSVAGQCEVTETIADLTAQTSGNTQAVSDASTTLHNGAAATRQLAGQVHDISSKVSLQLSRLLQETSETLLTITGDITATHGEEHRAAISHDASHTSPGPSAAPRKALAASRPSPLIEATA